MTRPSQPPNYKDLVYYCSLYCHVITVARYMQLKPQLDNMFWQRDSIGSFEEELKEANFTWKA